MTPKQVQRKRKSIYEKQVRLSEELYELQSICTHPTVTKQYRGSSGNYDPSNDGYWINWHCPDCDKRWTTDQSRENILKPGIKIS